MNAKLRVMPQPRHGTPKICLKVHIMGTSHPNSATASVDGVSSRAATTIEPHSARTKASPNHHEDRIRFNLADIAHQRIRDGPR